MGKILADKRHALQHPGKQPIGIDPHPGRVGNVIFKVPVGVQSCKPVPPRLVYKNRVNFATDFIDQPVAQEAVFAAAGQDTMSMFVRRPQLPL